MLLFIKLFLRFFAVHLVCDFMLQTDKFCENKRFSSWQLYIHAFIVGLFSWIVLYSPGILLESVLCASLIGASHLLFDGVKSMLAKRFKEKITDNDKLADAQFNAFCVDQVLHIIVLIIAASIFLLYCKDDWKTCDLEFYSVDKLILLFVGSYLCCKPSNITIKLFLEKYKIGSSLAKSDTDSSEESERKFRIQNAGHIIGSLERLLCFVSILVGHIDIIGFLIAAKSILRFKDNNAETQTEYVLVGTLMSFGMAIVIGFLTNKCMLIL
ncbi:MAG: DUF3307 domain-containing protein [Paludibacteraceae bacterium]|nr:DUF3307 domain-containing protein [Paludibacteraceae bacterium]